MRRAVSTMFAPRSHPAGRRVLDLRRACSSAVSQALAPCGRCRRAPTSPRGSSSAATCAAPRSASGGTSHASSRGSARRASAASIRSRATRSANTSPSSSEFDARRFAPCTPVRATSPHGVEAREARAAAQVGHDAAHHVVRGRRHRDEILARIDAARPAEREDARKALRERLRRACARRGRRGCRPSARGRSRAPRRRAARARRAGAASA